MTARVRSEHRCQDRLRRDVETSRIDVGKARNRAQVGAAVGAGAEGDRAGHEFVTGTVSRAANAAACRAAVPEENATANGASQHSAIACSNSVTAGPCVNQSPRGRRRRLARPVVELVAAVRDRHRIGQAIGYPGPGMTGTTSAPGGLTGTRDIGDEAAARLHVPPQSRLLVAGGRAADGCHRALLLADARAGRTVGLRDRDRGDRVDARAGSSGTTRAGSRPRAA